MHTQTRLASLLIACAAALTPLAIAPANAQQTWKQLPGQEKYVQPYEPFRVVGNLYYVGTYDAAVSLCYGECDKTCATYTATYTEKRK